jgi:hypothetical protein
MLNVNRVPVYWIVGAAIIVLGVAWEQGFFSGAARRLHQLTGKPARVPLSSSEVRSMGNGYDRSTKSLSANSNRPDSTTNRAVLAQVTNENKPRPPPAMHADIDASVVGTPFPISASVVAGCRDHECDKVREQLAKMADEPRDSAWATEMEIEIQNNIISKGQDRYMIRDIECRTSICAVETASLFGLYDPGYPVPLNSSLTGGGIASIWGYESDPSSGARITVTVRVLMRR